MSNAKKRLPLSVLRITVAELLAASVCELFPGTLLVGATNHHFGFFYDFIFEREIDERAVPLIEEKMREIVKECRPIVTQEMLCRNAVEYFNHHSQEMRANFLKDLDGGLVKIFRLGDFFDFCQESYAKSLEEIEVFKIREIQHFEKEYFSKKVKITRILGVACHDRASLKSALKALEVAKKIDHRLLGREMKLFDTDASLGEDRWFWLPKGAILRQILENWWFEEHKKQSFLRVYTPALLEGLTCKSEPSHAPLHALLFKSEPRSLEDLPMRYAELGELCFKGEDKHLWGMLQTQSYFSDTATIFCGQDQLFDELISSLQFIEKIARICNFRYKLYLYSCSKKQSSKDKFLVILRKVLQSCDLDYEERVATCCAPRLEVRFVDFLQREWKGPEIAIDTELVKKLKLCYRDGEGKECVPVMVRRALFGSLERFIAVLIEHRKGIMPLCFIPEQVRVIPVSDECVVYAKSICEACNEHGLRVTVDLRNEQLKGKVKAANCEKIPYILVVGEKEKQQELVSVRHWNRKDVQKMRLDIFIERTLKEVKARM